VKAGVFSAEQMAAARGAMEHMYYAGSSFEAWLSAVDSADAEQGGGDAAAAAQAVHVPPELGQEEARAKFPVGVAALDSLVETPAFLDMYEQCLGDKAVFCDAHLFHRAGLTDKRHPADPFTSFHMDHNTNCWLPPAPDGAFGYVNATAYLNDVGEDSAAMLVCAPPACLPRHPCFPSTPPSVSQLCAGPGSHRRAVEITQSAHPDGTGYPFIAGDVRNQPPELGLSDPVSPQH